MAPLPPIFNPRILYGVDPFPYTPLKMFGDYNRQIEQPADVFPTLSIMTGLDPNNKGDVARFDANHNLKVVTAGGGAGAAVSLVGRNTGSATATANTTGQAQGTSGGTAGRLLSVVWSMNLNTAFPAADSFGYVSLWVYPTGNAGNGRITLCSCGFQWRNASSALFGGPFGGETVFPGGIDLSSIGFGNATINLMTDNTFGADVLVEFQLAWVT